MGSTLYELFLYILNIAMDIAKISSLVMVNGQDKHVRETTRRTESLLKPKGMKNDKVSTSFMQLRIVA